MASISPVSATTVVYCFRDSSSVMIFSWDATLVSRKLIAVDRDRNPAKFKLINLGQAAAMAFCAAEPRTEEVLRALPRDRDAGSSTAEAEDVHVVILHALARREVIMAKGGAH